MLRMRGTHAPVLRSRPARVFSALGSAIAFALATGCGGSDGPTGAGPVLTLAGRVERGASVEVVVHSGGDSLAGAALLLDASPADAAEVGANGTLVLRRAGTLTVSAKLPDGSSATAMFEVPAPPSIVFDLAVDGNRDIYRAALDGEDFVRLTTADGDDVDPTSAAGVVVFTSYRNGSADLYALTLDDGHERRLTSTTAGELEPALSADGERLAFVSTSSGVGRVWIAAADATNGVPASADVKAGAPEAAPAWGAGDGLVFVSTASGSADLVTVAAGAAPARPTAIASARSEAAEVEGAWNAAGDRLAFISTRSGAPKLYLLDVDAGRLDSLASANGYPAQPAWLPDGRLVFVTLRDGASTLHWFDSAFPDVVHDVPLPAGNPRRPAAVR